MASAIRAGGQLAGIAACLLLLGVYLAAEYVTRNIRDVLNFRVAGIRPLHFLAVAIDRLLVQGAQAGVRAMSGALESLLSGLADSLAMLVGIPLALGLALKEALQYFWNRALTPKIRALTDPISQSAREALSRIRALTERVASEARRLEGYAAERADRAEARARAYATSAINAVRGDVMRYADEAVEKLRRADAAAIGAVEGLAGDVADQLNDLRKKVGTPEFIALVAAIPALGALVHTIATEAGLDNAECRGKVRSVCTTDPAAWANMIAGLALIGVGFSLRDLFDLAVPLIDGFAEVVAEAA